MLLIGISMLVVGIALRAFLFPAEYSMAGPREDRASIFLNSGIAMLYWLIEKSLRLGGAFLVAFHFFPVGSTLLGIVGGGLVFGVLAFAIAPALSMGLAMMIHPYFKSTLDDNNRRR